MGSSLSRVKQEKEKKKRKKKRSLRGHLKRRKKDKFIIKVIKTFSKLHSLIPKTNFHTFCQKQKRKQSVIQKTNKRYFSGNDKTKQNMF